MYAGGLAALASDSYDTVSALLTKPKVRDRGGEQHPLVMSANVGNDVIDWNAMSNMPGLKNYKTPVNQYLFALLREPLREFLPDDVAYERNFDRFEYLLGLVHIDISNNLDWAPTGCFIWRNWREAAQTRVAGAMRAEAKAAGKDWPPLVAGLFHRSMERFNEVQDAYDKFVANYVSRHGW